MTGIQQALSNARFRLVGDVDDDVRVEVADLWVKLSTWRVARRVVAVRISEQDSLQLSLGGIRCRYELVVTNLDWDAEDVWRFYNRRCEAENVIKELKRGYGIDKLSTGSFGANTADLLLKIISFNLVWMFRHHVLPGAWSRFTTRILHQRLFRIPGVVVEHARRVEIRLASWYQRIPEFTSIAQRGAAMST